MRSRSSLEGVPVVSLWNTLLWAACSLALALSGCSGRVISDLDGEAEGWSLSGAGDESLGLMESGADDDDDDRGDDDDDDDDRGDDDDDDDRGDDDDDDDRGDDDADDSSDPLPPRLDLAPEPACSGDVDCDGIPDDFDLFMMDPSRPGTVEMSSLYAIAQGDGLLRIDPQTLAAQELGTLHHVYGETLDLTDIAIDNYGVLYAVNGYEIFVCSVEEMLCYPIAEGLIDTHVVGAGFIPLEGTGTEVLILTDHEGSLLAVMDRIVAPFSIWVGSTAPYLPQGDVDAFRGLLFVTAYSISDVYPEGRLLTMGPSRTGEAFYEAIAEFSLSGLLSWIDGLAVADSTIFLLDDLGIVARFDPLQGTNIELFSLPYRFRGAAWH